MDIQIIRSNRKSVSITITGDAEVYVRAPKKMTDHEIQSILEKRSGWIRTHLQKVEKTKAMAEKAGKITEDELKELYEKAAAYLPGRVSYFSKLIGVDYHRITIRHQKTRWGSCSAKGNLNFNCLLMLTPEEIIDYVVVHELCHRKEMNHSANFWREVGEVIPDYRERQKWLSEHGAAIIRRS